MKLGTPPNARQVRKAFIEKHLDVHHARIIEFGAFDYPTYSKPDYNITYVDFFSKAELAALHNAAKPERVKNAIDFDFIVKEADFAPQINERFDLLIANHVFEHIPDAIRWLQNAEKLLTPETGRTFFSVPDKNYTFDFLRPVSRLTDFIVAHEERLERPSVQQVFESIYLYRPIKANHVWEDDGTLSTLLEKARYPNARVAWESAKAFVAQGGWKTVQCTFQLLFRELKKGGYTRLEVLHSDEWCLQ